MAPRTLPLLLVALLLTTASLGPAAAQDAAPPPSEPGTDGSGYTTTSHENTTTTCAPDNSSSPCEPYQCAPPGSGEDLPPCPWYDCAPPPSENGTTNGTGSGECAAPYDPGYQNPCPPSESRNASSSPCYPAPRPYCEDWTSSHSANTSQRACTATYRCGPGGNGTCSITERHQCEASSTCNATLSYRYVCLTAADAPADSCMRFEGEACRPAAGTNEPACYPPPCFPAAESGTTRTCEVRYDCGSGACHAYHQPPPPQCHDAAGNPVPCGSDGSGTGGHCVPADGGMRCTPPPECEGRMNTTDACTPPAECRYMGDGTWMCPAPQPHPTCRDPSTGHTVPCPTPHQPPNYVCEPAGNDTVHCKPTGECATTTNNSACQPPPNCQPTGDGSYLCERPAHGDPCAAGGCPDPATQPRCAPVNETTQRCYPPESCAGRMNTTESCTPPPVCTYEANGAYLCPRHAGSGEGVCNPDGTCTESPRSPPPAPAWCTPEQLQRAAQSGMRPACMIPPTMDSSGRYVPPAGSLQGCAMPAGAANGTDDSMNGTHPAPAYCPPRSFAPPPPDAASFQAWEVYARQMAPESVVAAVRHGTEAWAELDAPTRARVHAAGAAAGFFAPAAYDGRSLNASFVSASLDADTLRMRDYRVQGVQFFTDMRVNDAGAQPKLATAAGTRVVAASDNAVVEARNNAMGTVSYRAETRAYTVTLNVTDGYSIVKDGPVYILTKGEWKGIVAASATTFANGTLTLNVAPDKPAHFMAIPPGTTEGQTRVAIGKGIALGNVGAEMSILGREGTHVTDAIEYNGVSLRLREARADQVSVDLSSAEHHGRSVVLTIDREALATPLTQLRVTLDGVALTEVANLDLVMSNATGAGKYFLTANETTLRLVVGIPHFSDHVLAVGKTADEPGTPTDGNNGADANTTTDGDKAAATAPQVPGPGALVLLAALGAAGLALRGRARKE